MEKPPSKGGFFNAGMCDDKGRITTRRFSTIGGNTPSFSFRFAQCAQA
jgi:hypothetical protein